MRDGRRYGLILAGGRGTRFWPRSRTANPKQLLSFLTDRSLLQETVARLSPAIPPERIWVLTSRRLRAEVIRQLPGVPAHQVLAEPAQRNTAPCLGLAAAILHQENPDALLGVFPADHHIARPAQFRKLLGPAFAAAAGGKLATIGIQPRWPETGYGYLEFPAGVKAGDLRAIPVRRFREKPGLRTAKRYVAAGNFYWNAGMFFWRADAFLEALREYLPRTAAVLASLPRFSDPRFARRLKETYPLAENISVDYAVMEKAAKAGRVAGVGAGDIGWSDLGSWNAVYELSRKDSSGNALRSPGLAIGSTGCLVEAGGKLVALVGVKDLVVVDSAGALLVARRRQAQKVGEVVKLVEKQGRGDLL